MVSAWEKQMWESVVLTILMHSYYTAFINLADALIQSDFQMRKTQHLLANYNYNCLIVFEGLLINLFILT